LEYVIILLQLIVGISLLNVWLIQPNKPSRWRGGDAKTLKEEFNVYGLPEQLFYIIGFFKVGFAVILLASIYFSAYTDLAAYGLAFFLSGSILMHIKIKDPIEKSFPAVLFLSMCLVIALLN